MHNKYKLSYNEFIVFGIICNAYTASLSLGYISRLAGGMPKSSVARATAGLTRKGYVGRRKSVRRQKSCTQVSQRRAVYKYRINKQLRDIVFRHGRYCKYRTKRTYNYIYIYNTAYRIYNKDYYSCRRVRYIYNNKRNRLERKKMTKQGELLPVGQRYKKKRKSQVGVLMAIWAKEHKKLYGTFYRPKNEEFIFASQEIKKMLAEFREAYREGGPAERQKLASGPYGAYLRSTMQPVRVLAWCIRHIYGGPLKDRDFPFQDGFRDFKHIIWATRLYRTLYEDNWYERRWRQRITVGNKQGEADEQTASTEAEEQEPEIDDATKIENARRRREEFLKAIEEGGNMGVKRGSKRAVCGNKDCERHGKLQWLEPEWLGQRGWICKSCGGVVAPYKQVPTKAEAPAEVTAPPGTEPEAGVTAEPEPEVTAEPESESEPEPDETGKEDDSWLEGNEPEEISRPKEDPMHPGGPAPQIKIGTLVQCQSKSCKAVFYINKHTRGRCHVCGRTDLREYVPPQKNP